MTSQNIDLFSLDTLCSIYIDSVKKSTTKENLNLEILHFYIYIKNINTLFRTLDLFLPWMALLST
jgi:hypothetical protein